MRRNLGVLLVACALVFAASGTAVAGADVTAAPGPFRGLGAWVDVFDFAPAFQDPGTSPSVTPSSVADMAALGVRTLYLQAAMNDDRSPDKIVDSSLVGDFLARAHRAGMQVVAWYFPTLTDPAVDLAHVQAMVDFRARGQKFDAVALDIEATQGLTDVDVRNDRAVDLVASTRKLVGDQPLGVVVYPAVQLEVLNQALWPKFPYKRLAKYVDVWMPMAYWTFRSGPYRDPYAYTTESVARLRNNLGDQRAVVHPIGGIGDLSSIDDYGAYMRAVVDTNAVGWSVYDFNTTASSAWPMLRVLPAITSTTTRAAPATPAAARSSPRHAARAAAPTK